MYTIGQQVGIPQNTLEVETDINTAYTVVAVSESGYGITVNIDGTHHELWSSWVVPFGMPEMFQSWSLDEVAECAPYGITTPEGKALYATLWDNVDNVEYLSEIWIELPEGQQSLLKKAATKIENR